MGTIVCAALLPVASAAFPVSPISAQRDYLTAVEADKIRDTEDPSGRIKLFLSFATDRLKKFQFELARPSADRRRAKRLNSLLNAYAGCVDDAAEIIELAREKQQDVRAGVREMQNKAKDFLATLEKLAAGGAELSSYEETLKDALEATRDALREAEEAAKEIAPPPVRRRP
jgi:methyl-accepting chemotaxis protein